MTTVSVAVAPSSSVTVRVTVWVPMANKAVGVAPVLGRALQPSDDRAQADRVLVITHGLWQRRYGGARDVIGRRLTVRDQPFTIVGVMPRDFAYPAGIEAWMTVEALVSLVSNPIFREAARSENDLVARVREGVTHAQVGSELEGMVTRLEADTRRDMPRGMRPVVRPYEEAVVGEVRPALELARFVGGHRSALQAQALP